MKRRKTVSVRCERSRYFRFKSLQYLFSLLLQPTHRLPDISKRLAEKKLQLNDTDAYSQAKTSFEHAN